MVLKKFLVLGVMLGSAVAMAQVAPSSHGGNATLWIGAEFSSFDPDYDGLETLGPTQRLIGPGAFIDFNLTPKLGIEGETHWLRFNGNGGETQNDYLAGVKYRVFRWNKLSINAKFLLGGVWIKYPVGIGSGSYFAYAPGALVDYRLSRRFSLRGDYEYQFIPSAPGLYPGESNGLSPNGFSVGVAYRLLGIR